MYKKNLIVAGTLFLLGLCFISACKKEEGTDWDTNLLGPLFMWCMMSTSIVLVL